MSGTESEAGPEIIGQGTASAAPAPVSGMKSSDVQKIVDTLKAVGKDPNTTSLTEAHEICRMLEAAKQHDPVKNFKPVLIILGILAIVSIIGMVMLAVSGKTVPGSLIALGSAALGLFAGIVAASVR